jgi:phage/plasmid primase-like uncharacterized protein
MVELLAIEKRRLLSENGQVTRQDFSDAWERSWHTMVLERGWAHATKHRRSWRRAMVATRRECRAAFLGEPSAFAFAATRLTEVAGGMCLRLEPDQVGKALLAAIAYVEVDTEQKAEMASDAASMFMALPAGGSDQPAL